MRVTFRDFLAALFGASVMALTFGVWYHSEKWISGAVCIMIVFAVAVSVFCDIKREG